MRFISWNVNGLRARSRQRLFGIFQEADADIFFLTGNKIAGRAD